MSFEKPSVEAQGEADSSAVEKPESAKAEMASMDDLLSNINSEPEPLAPEGNKAETEKKVEEQVNESMPAIEKLIELSVGDMREIEGRMDYATLSGNVDLYIQAKKDDLQRISAEKQLARELVAKLYGPSRIRGDSVELRRVIEEKVGGTNERDLDWSIQNADRPIEWPNSHIPAFRERATLEFWDTGKDSARAGAEAEMRDRMGYSDDGMIMRNGVITESVRTPNDFVENMAGRQKRVENEPGYDAKRKADTRIDSRAFGFGLAALEVGDVEVAAKSLAFSDRMRALDGARVSELKEVLAKLEPSARKEFARVYEENRKG